MKYELDTSGYILATYWGCRSGNYVEYTGTVPLGYSNLVDWSENALINAYYINNEGNLTLDVERQAELELKIIQDTIDNTPVLNKDLVGSNEVLDSQYMKKTAKGKILNLTNVQNITPKVKLTGIECYNYSNINIYSHGYNLIKNDGKTETIGGINFTKNLDGSIKIGASKGELGKNILPTYYNKGFTYTTNGITFTINNDYSININGTATANAFFNLNNVSGYYVNVFENKYYTLNLGVANSNISFALRKASPNEVLIYLQGTKTKTSLINYTGEASAYIRVTSGATIENVTVYPMVVEGSFSETTIGDYEPYQIKTKIIEYNLSGSSTNTTPIFVLKKNTNYYLNLNGCSCEMKYFDGETTSQVYVGNDGLINLTEDKKVTQVLLKTPTGEASKTIYPMLNYGTTAKKYEAYKSKVLNIDFANYIDEEVLYPNNTLYPSDSLYPLGTGIDYIAIENGKVYISKNGWESVLCAGNVQLFNGNNTIYVDEDINIDIEYSINILKVEEVFNAKIEKTEQEINLSVDSKLTNYSTTEEMNSAINLKADSITSTVSKTYATKTELNTAKSEIKQTTDSISSTVSKKVGNNEIISKINQTAENITIDANRININGTVSANGNFKIDTAGNMECNNASVTGKITATEGVFENCTIKNTCSVPASTVSGTLASSNIPNISAGKITSGTMSGDRINGGEITGSSFNGISVGADAIGLHNEYGAFSVGSYTGKTTNITIPIGITVDSDGRVTGQTWRRLVFKGGILVEVQSSW